MAQEFILNYNKQKLSRIKDKYEQKLIGKIFNLRGKTYGYNFKIDRVELIQPHAWTNCEAELYFLITNVNGFYDNTRHIMNGFTVPAVSVFNGSSFNMTGFSEKPIFRFFMQCFDLEQEEISVAYDAHYYKSRCKKYIFQR